MKRIEDLFIGDIRHEERKRGKKKCLPLPELLTYRSIKAEYKKFEEEVPSYLNKNKEGLCIKEVYQLKNMLVDLMLKLNNGMTVLVEVKYALNWYTSCNARVEIQRFMAERLYEKCPKVGRPERALIIFNHFSRDWNEQPQGRRYKNGWNFFYEEEKALRGKFPTVPIDIVQLTEEGLINFELVQASLR